MSHLLRSGFDFSNANRCVNLYSSQGIRLNSSDSNAFLESKGATMPKATSTGTTIVGCLFKDGIVLGADTRATAGPIVADKNCEKVRLARQGDLPEA
jgi:20S proteasome alpha/beta subunit